MEWVEGVGDSVDAAKEMALEALGVHEDDAEVDIVSEAKVGLFNRVKERARVRARVRPATPRTKDDHRRRRGRAGNGGVQPAKAKNRSGEVRGQTGTKDGAVRSDSQKATRASETKSQKANSARSAGGHGNRNRNQNGGREAAPKSRDDNMETMTLPEQADIAEAFVTGLAAAFGESVTFDRTEVDENEIRIVVNGENLGRMIGRRGATASAIDELVRTVLQRQAGGGREGRVRIDVGGVAGRREEALRVFCRKVAEQVRETGKEVALESMRGSDRKVVHDAMASEEGVGTISEGEDPNRRVVVVPAGNDD